MTLPSQEVLGELLDYDPATGKLSWKRRSEEWFPHKGHNACLRWNKTFAGKAALDSLNSDGYRRGTLLLRSYLAHRIIWKLVHGVDPIDIDHIDGNRQNNRIENLRSVSRAENLRNIRVRAGTVTGVIGVAFYKRVGRYTARINIGGGRYKHLGYFDTIEEASAVRKAAEAEYGFHPNHGRSA